MTHLFLTFTIFLSIIIVIGIILYIWLLLDFVVVWLPVKQYVNIGWITMNIKVKTEWNENGMINIF